MKLILREYVQNLKERKELEFVLMNLLSAMGLVVLSEPRRGTTQKGVDILAVGKAPCDAEDTVYLLTLKEGDIKRGNWGGAQGVRESIQQIFDAYIPSRLASVYSGLPKKVVLCFGGVVDETLQEDWRGFRQGLSAVATANRATIEEWNGDRIAKLLSDYMMGPQLLVSEKRKWIAKTLAMIDEPSVANECFLNFLRSYAVESDASDEKQTYLNMLQMSVALDLIRHHAIESANLNGAYQSAEQLFLLAWKYMGDVSTKAKSWQKKFLGLYDRLWWMYVEIADKYLEKIEWLVGEQYLFTSGCRSNTELDVNISLFDTLGRLSSFGSGLLCYMESVRDPLLQDEMNGLAIRVRDVVLRLIKENPTACCPMRDDMAFEIGMISLFLSQMRRSDFIRDWLHALLERQQTNFIFQRSYPAYGLTYSELLNHVRIGGDGDHQKRVMGSSSLFAVVALVSAALNHEENFAFLSRLKDRFFADCNLQLWYPQKDSELSFYDNRQPHGKAQTSLDIADRGRFTKRISDECEISPLDLSAWNSPYRALVFMGCRLYRYPLPPHLFLPLSDSQQPKKGDGQC